MRRNLELGLIIAALLFLGMMVLSLIQYEMVCEAHSWNFNYNWWSPTNWIWLGAGCG